MKDRIPTYPGRVRMTPVQGQENVYDMERADEPTQVGTPLNKETLLDNDTVNRLNGADSMTPNEAFNAVIDESGFCIGDILTGYDYLTDDWIPCDGKVVDQSEYPELWDKLPLSASTSVVTLPAGGGTMDSDWQAIGDKRMYDVNGYYVCFQKAYLYYRRKDETTWHYTNWDGIRSNFTIYSSRWWFIGVVYDDVNEVYGVAIGYSKGTSAGTYNTVVFTVSSLSDSPSTYTTISTAQGYANIKYFFAKYGATYFLYAGANLLYSTNLTGTYTSFGFSTYRKLEYIDGRYVLLGYTAVTEDSSTVYKPTVWISQRTTNFANRSMTSFVTDRGKYSNTNGAMNGVGYLKNHKILITQAGLVTSNAGGQLIDLSGTTPTLIKEYDSTTYFLMNTYSYDMDSCINIGDYLYAPMCSLSDNPKIDVDTIIATRNSMTKFSTNSSVNLRYMTSEGYYKIGSVVYKFDKKTLPSLLEADNLNKITKIKAKGSPYLSGEVE